MRRRRKQKKRKRRPILSFRFGAAFIPTDPIRWSRACPRTSSSSAAGEPRGRRTDHRFQLRRDSHRRGNAVRQQRLGGQQPVRRNGQHEVPGLVARPRDEGRHIGSRATPISTRYGADFGGACQLQNSGDPIVLFDKAANRWLISQFTANVSGGSYFQCVAISQTASATGACFRYAFAVPGATSATTRTSASGPTPTT